MPKPLEFWFEFASTYSYIAAMRVEAACRAANVPLGWKPFLLGPLFTAQLGIKDSPFNVNPVRGRYMWRDMERLCSKYGLPWRRPGQFPRNSILAARVACVGADRAWMGPFVRGVFRANFAEDQDISDPAVLSRILEALEVDPGPVLAEAATPGIKEQLRANTSRATELGIFGAPNCVTGGELFFGQDRLDDAIAWASTAD